RLSWRRFLDFDLGGPAPDENTIRPCRNKLTQTGTLKAKAGNEGLRLAIAQEGLPPDRRADAQGNGATNGKKLSVRARAERVFAHQKMRFGLFIRTIGLPRAEAKLTLAKL